MTGFEPKFSYAFQSINSALSREDIAKLHFYVISPTETIEVFYFPCGYVFGFQCLA